MVDRQQVAETGSARGETWNGAPLGMTLTRSPPSFAIDSVWVQIPRGVLVAKVAPGGRADESGLRSGDVDPSSGERNGDDAVYGRDRD
jgi:S1-C subfamily serine protease